MGNSNLRHAAAFHITHEALTELQEAREQVATWKAHAEADHAKLEQVAELVQQWRAKGAQADFLGVVNVWDEAADQLSKVLAEGGEDDHG